MRLFTYPRSQYDERNINKKIVEDLIKKHRAELPRYEKLKKYYLGQHDIMQKQRRKGQPNYKTVCNHAKDIADTATGYFMGNSITYSNTANSDIESLLLAFDNAEVDEADHDNAISMAIYGVSYEYIYAKENTNELNIKYLEPENTFIVYDDSIEQLPLFAVYYFKLKDDVKDTETYQATILTENYQYTILLEGKNDGSINEQPTKHNMGGIPVIEYRNNKFLIGDFEQQIGLIDAYNSLMANRVNDKEQFIDAILVIYGARLGDSAEKSAEAIRMLSEMGILELPFDKAKADYLTRTLNENEVETLKNAIKHDIYTFSHVPNLTDESFAGNTSGVAMEFKLLGLEMITKTKQRYYTKGLKQRIRLFCNYLNLQSILVESNSIVPHFSRSLPKNLLELSQIVNNLDGKVSLETLIGQLPFVEDPVNEIEKVKEEKKENIERATFETITKEYTENNSFDKE